MKRTMSALALTLALTGCAGGGSDTATPQKTVDPVRASAEAFRLAQNAENAVKASASAAARKAELDRILVEASIAAAAPPKPEDWTLSIIVLEKSCFGSAGCNVTFRIDPKYSGGNQLKDLEVTYEVLGGEDPMIRTFEVDEEGTATYDSEDMISVPSSKTEIRARVTSVRKA